MVHQIEVAAWDNHGRYLYGIVDRQLHGWNMDLDEDFVLCSGEEIPEGRLISLDTRVDDTLVGAIQSGIDLLVFTIDFTFDESFKAICEIRTFEIPNAALYVPEADPDADTDDDDESIPQEGDDFGFLITAVTFDDTVCVSSTGGTGIGSNGGDGNQGGDGGGDGGNNNDGGSNNGGDVNLPEVNPPPPGTTTNTGSAGSDSAFPGDDTNYVLTGTTGEISTAVVGALGAGSVALFAIFAVIFGMNTVKEDPQVPLDALLVENEASSIASDNPIFQATAGASTNIVGA